LDRFESIYTAALDLYNKYGFLKVNVQEIADAAGVSKKTIYNHFKGKKDLFYRTFEWHVFEIVDFYDSLLSNNSHSLPEKLVLALNHSFRQINYKTGPIYEDIRKYNPFLKKSPMQYIQGNIHESIGLLVEQSQKEGICRDDLSSDSITHVILSMIRGIFLWENPSKTNITISELFTSSMILIVESLLTEKGRLLLSEENLDFSSLILSK